MDPTHYRHRPSRDHPRPRREHVDLDRTGTPSTGHPAGLHQTTPTDTVIEAETVEQVFAALQAAPQAIPDDRVITSIEIDDDRRRPQQMSQRVDSVERALGHPPYRYQQAVGQVQTQSPPPQTQAQLPPPGQPPGQPRGQPYGRTQY